MTETRRPKPCHRDRNLDQRVTRAHRDDCPTHNGHPCPGRDGCAPCTAHHCVLCTRRHLDNTHPLTCPDCIAQVREDLHEIRWLCRHLRWQATRGGHDGRLTAAAPIPGGNAMVLIARAGADGDQLRTFRGFTLDHHNDDHHARDVIHPLLPLVALEQTWRTYFGHTHRTDMRPAGQNHARASVTAVAPVTAITHYFADHLHTMAQAVDGPDWQGFARDIATLRRQLEAVLHDEQEPEQGVPCFECGDRLVRRFGKPRPCRHVREAQGAGVTVTQWVYTLSTYPELDEDHGRCRDQGGIENPDAGQSWECIGCRKHYTPGEYANAVRAHLLQGGPDGDGWTHIAMAAEAASTMTGYLIAPATVRRWMDRTKVASCCRWTSTVDQRPAPLVPRPQNRGSFAEMVEEFAGRVESAPWGLRLVYWPDVADEAAKFVQRAVEAEARRRRIAAEDEAWAKAIAAGEDPEAAGVRIGIAPARLRHLLDRLEEQAS